MKYLIGVDIGTQGTKAALYDENMTLVGTAFQESNLIMSDTGGIWQEADEIYRSVILSIRQLVLESGVSGSCIEGIGIDSQMAGIMGIDSDGEAATYFDSWLDTRCGKYVDFMERTAGESPILQEVRYLMPMGLKFSGGKTSILKSIKRYVNLSCLMLT